MLCYTLNLRAVIPTNWCRRLEAAGRSTTGPGSCGKAENSDCQSENIGRKKKETQVYVVNSTHTT